MDARWNREDCLGLIKPSVDAHSLGLFTIAQLLDDCVCRSCMADSRISEACNHPERTECADLIKKWIKVKRITLLGISYRLNPEDGARIFSIIIRQLRSHSLLSFQGGPIRKVFFAGLPETCRLVKRFYPEISGVFCGDETPVETLSTLGIPIARLPHDAAQSLSYDEDRLSFGKDVLNKGDYITVRPVDRSGYHAFGNKEDSVVKRLEHAKAYRLPPLIRAHVGPYLPDRREAIKLFLSWSRQLASEGFLDILSIGTSQLTQSCFQEDWGDSPNGGGVPINSPQEFADVWRSSRPLLVRTYAGTKNILSLARMYERTMNIAWHALSFWWFCKIDNRGPYNVYENLNRHMDTLIYIASTGKPFEPNVPHHFAFRGTDDVSYIASAYIAAKTAKLHGIHWLILQNMLNTPKYTWGVADLAKSRALLKLARSLEDDNFHLILQPRGGLDFFSPDLNKAKVQLAAVTALMDDIEPNNNESPKIIHVVSYSEAQHLADPSVIRESIQIVRESLEQYRRLRRKGLIDDMSKNREVASRTEELIIEASTLIKAIESLIRRPYTAHGLYQIFASGFFPVPYLWECREEFANAIGWQTRLVNGSMRVVDEKGSCIPASERVRKISVGNKLSLSE